MKKFLLSSVFVLLIAGAYAQSCPTNLKRNNGNACTSGGTGGGVEVEFLTNPADNLQIYLIVNPATGLSSSIIPSTRVESTRAGKWFIDWCFEVDNLGAVVRADYNYQFYLDLAPLGQYNGEQIFICSQSTLPVTLVNFNAAQKSNKVSLTWETILELNNDGFEIERRIGNGKYEKIAFVDSKAPGGNGTAYSYSFEDNTTLPKGVSYYRLRQVDFDGRATYSEIRAVRTGKGIIAVSVYPNPSRGTTNVAIPDGVGTVDISLNDFTGKSVQRWNGLNTRSLQLNNLKPGMYTLRISIRETGETITERISVQ